MAEKKKKSRSNPYEVQPISPYKPSNQTQCEEEHYSQYPRYPSRSNPYKVQPISPYKPSNQTQCEEEHYSQYQRYPSRSNPYEVQPISPYKPSNQTQCEEEHYPQDPRYPSRSNPYEVQPIAPYKSPNQTQREEEHYPQYPRYPSTQYIPREHDLYYPNYSPHVQPSGVVVITQPNPNEEMVDENQQPPDNHLFLSIFACLFCCWLTGIIAIWNSVASMRFAKAGDLERAGRKSRDAKTYSLISISFGVIGTTITLVLRFVYYPRSNPYEVQPIPPYKPKNQTQCEEEHYPQDPLYPSRSNTYEVQPIPPYKPKNQTQCEEEHYPQDPLYPSRSNPYEVQPIPPYKPPNQTQREEEHYPQDPRYPSTQYLPREHDLYHPNYSPHVQPSGVVVITQPNPNGEIVDKNQQPPENQLCLAIFATVCCCWLIGIFAIREAVISMRLAEAGHLEAARRTSRNAKIYSVISMGVGVIVITTTLAVRLVYYRNSY